MQNHIRQGLLRNFGIFNGQICNTLPDSIIVGRDGFRRTAVVTQSQGEGFRLHIMEQSPLQLTTHAQSLEEAVEIFEIPNQMVLLAILGEFGSGASDRMLREILDSLENMDP